MKRRNFITTLLAALVTAIVPVSAESGPSVDYIITAKKKLDNQPIPDCVRTVRYDSDKNYTEVLTTRTSPDGTEWHDLVGRTGGDYRNDDRAMQIFYDSEEAVYRRYLERLSI